MKMKKEAESDIKKSNHFDLAKIKATFNKANEFITNLWKISPIPTTEIDYTDDENDGEGPGATNSKPIRAKFAKSYGTGTRAKSLEELHNKLEVLKGKRASYKENLLKKGLKNRISKKAKKEERALKKKLIKKHKQKANKEAKIIIPEEKKFKPTKPVYNSEGKMVFSKFDFSESSSADQTVKKLDPKAMLVRIEKQKEKLKRLEQTGDKEKVKVVKEGLAWKAALEKSEGVKTKDDVALLAKTIKKNTLRKKHSKEKWAEREEAVKKKKDVATKKRTENIEKRKKQNKVNKLRKAAKKGRVIPGF